RAIGWWGRVLARTQAPDVELENYVLAVPHETTEDLNERWWGEASRRFPEETENRLVVALSDADLDLEATSTARSRLNLANVLDTASQRNSPVLVVGPTPTLDEQRNARLA
ncbi:lysophospholipase, partial [Micrococcus luteus]|nr:lysophospholipase [Micrococcus luteus]